MNEQNATASKLISEALSCLVNAPEREYERNILTAALKQLTPDNHKSESPALNGENYALALMAELKTGERVVIPDLSATETLSEVMKNESIKEYIKQVPVSPEQLSRDEMGRIAYPQIKDHEPVMPWGSIDINPFKKQPLRNEFLPKPTTPGLNWIPGNRPALEMVEEFHRAFNVPVADYPGIPEKSRRMLRYELMREELMELADAMHEGNMIKILDGLCDLLYVTYGTAHEFGLGPVLKQAFREVHRSNMSKLNVDGTPIIRNDGKILKGPNYSAPDLESILMNAGAFDKPYTSFVGTPPPATPPKRSDNTVIMGPINSEIYSDDDALTLISHGNRIPPIELKMDPMNKILTADDIELIMTCQAMPEQYDAYYQGNEVGYLRLMHGHFRVDYPTCGGKTIYQIDIDDFSGEFSDEQRPIFLNTAKEAIVKAILSEREDGTIPADSTPKHIERPGLICLCSACKKIGMEDEGIARPNGPDFDQTTR